MENSTLSPNLDSISPESTLTEVYENCAKYFSYLSDAKARKKYAINVANVKQCDVQVLLTLLAKPYCDQAFIDDYEYKQHKRAARIQKFKAEQEQQRPKRLTYMQKVYIRDNENMVNAKELAQKYNTSIGSIYRAQRGEFMDPHSDNKPTKAPRGYGPLTLEQKREIRDTKQDIPASQLAKEYNTSPQNIYNAKKGNFQDTQPINYRSILDNIPEEELRHYLKEKYDVEI